MNEFQPISDKDLKRGYWWITHRQTARRIFLGFFVGILAILLFFLAANIFKLFNQSSWQSKAAALSPDVNWQSWHLEHQPQTLQISRPQWFAVGAGRYNLVAFIKNPNPDWLVKSFEYNFVVNGQPLATEIGWLMPNDDKMILQLGYENVSGLKSLEIKLNDNIKWQRADASLPAIAWEITDLKFEPATTQEIDGEQIKLDPRLTWRVRNLSLYNFWQVNFQVALYNRDQLVAVNLAKATDFNSLTTKELTAVWLNNLPRVTTYQVIPDVNWLDQDNFKQVEIPLRVDERLEP